ncbi:DUF1804 family protein [Serratia ureilytica]
MVKRATRHRRGPATTELALLSEINQRLERIENNIDEVKSVATPWRDCRWYRRDDWRWCCHYRHPFIKARLGGCKYGVLAGNKGQAAQGLHLRADVAGDRRVAGRRVFVSARRWKKEAQDKGDDWDALRSAHACRRHSGRKPAAPF